MPDDFIKPKETEKQVAQGNLQESGGAGEQEKPPMPAVEQAPFVEERLEQPSAQGQSQQTQPALAVKDDGKVSALKEAEKLRGIQVEGAKLDFLLETAQSKGVTFAIEVAKKINDPCLLDLFHDKLVELKLSA